MQGPGPPGTALATSRGGWAKPCLIAWLCTFKKEVVKAECTFLVARFD